MTVHQSAHFHGGIGMTDSAHEQTMTLVVNDDGTIVVGGDIDMSGGPALDEAVSAHQWDSALTIDLGGVSFVDSSGLRSLLSAARQAKTAESAVVLRDVGPEVHRLLEITGTTDQFVIERRRGQ
jgi:anti-anti-sigma factor